MPARIPSAQIPGRGQEGFPVIWVVVTCAAAAIALLLLAILGIHLRNRSLVTRLKKVTGEVTGPPFPRLQLRMTRDSVLTLAWVVGASQARIALDLDSPLLKMLDFLGKYQKGWQLSVGRLSVSIGFDVPGSAEAEDLGDLIAARAGHLSTPNLKQQMEQQNVYKKSVMSYIHNMMGGSILDDDDMSQHDGRTSFFRTSNDIVDDCRPYLVVPAAGPIPKLPTLTPKDVSVPVALAKQLTKDFSLDAITEGSILRKCRSALGVVARAAVNSLHLGVILKESEQLDAFIHYILHIEQGYMDGGYHCKLHAADVTNRYVSLLHVCGLGPSASLLPPEPEEAQLMLSALVGAALHDYLHPQVNNALLVHEVTMGHAPLASRSLHGTVAFYRDSLYCQA